MWNRDDKVQKLSNSAVTVAGRASWRHCLSEDIKMMEVDSRKTRIDRYVFTKVTVWGYTCIPVQCTYEVQTVVCTSTVASLISSENL